MKVSKFKDYLGITRIQYDKEPGDTNTEMIMVIDFPGSMVNPLSLQRITMETLREHEILSVVNYGGKHPYSSVILGRRIEKA